MKKECCECLYFYAGWDEENDCALSPDNVDFGDCRRYPPARIDPLKPGIISITDFGFPLTWNDDWCGEFKVKRN